MSALLGGLLHLLLWLLQAVGWLLLVVLVLAVVALFIPASVWLTYEADVFSVKIGMLAPLWQVYPRASKRPTKKKPTKTNAEKKPSGKKSPVPVRQLVDALCGALRMAGMFTKLVFGAIKVKNINVYWLVRGEDAAQTAISYGQSNAWLFSVLAFLNNFIYLDFEEITLTPIFEEKFAGYSYFSCQVSAQLFIMVVGFIRLLQMLQQEDALRAVLMRSVRKPKEQTNRK